MSTSLFMATDRQIPVSACDSRPPWYAVRVQSNHEKIVATILDHKGFEEFLPLHKVRRRWSDRYKVIELPLFPGYLFCRVHLDQTRLLLTTPGFLHLVGTGKTPVPVDEAEIATIQSMVASGLPLAPWPSMAVGLKVRLISGPLMGLEGVITRIGERFRILVSVTLLHRSVSAEVDRDWLCPVDLVHNTMRRPRPDVRPTRGSALGLPGGPAR